MTGLGPEEVFASAGTGIHARGVGVAEARTPSENAWRNAQTAQALQKLHGLTPSEMREFAIKDQELKIRQQLADVTAQRAVAENAQDYSRVAVLDAQAVKLRDEAMAIGRMRTSGQNVEVGGVPLNIGDVMSTYPPAAYGGAGRGTATAADIQKAKAISEASGIPMSEALEKVLYSKGKSPNEAMLDVYKTLAPVYGHEKAKVAAEALIKDWYLSGGEGGSKTPSRGTLKDPLNILPK